jgi:hypothetical protein
LRRSTSFRSSSSSHTVVGLEVMQRAYTSYCREQSNGLDESIAL